jgi:cytochrome c-type biogenesis protein CcmF
VQKEMQIGSSMQIGPYSLLLQNFDTKAEKNYTAERMIIEVTRDNKPVMMLYPERRIFPANQASGTMVAIYSTLKQDLYVVYAGQSPDTQAPVIHVYLNPLVKCIWFGGVIVVLGTLVALLPNRRAVLVLSAVQEPTRVKSLAGTLTPSPTLREGHD